MGRTIDRDGLVPHLPDRSAVGRVWGEGARAARAVGPVSRLTTEEAAAALGVPLEALLLGENPPEPGEGAAAALVQAHAVAEAPSAAPPAAARLLALAAEGRPGAAALCRAIEADPRVASAVVARAGEEAIGAARISLIRAVASLGVEEAAQLAAAWAVQPIAARPLAGLGREQASLWPELLRGALVIARLAALLGGGARLDPERRGQLAGRAFAAGLLGSLGSAAALRSLAALRQEGTVARLPRRGALRVVLAARGGLDAGLRRAWGLELAGAAGTGPDGPAGPAGSGWWRPERWLVRLAGAVDALARGPGADPRAAADAFEAAGRLGFTPPALAVAVVRHRDAAAWAERLLAGT